MAQRYGKEKSVTVKDAGCDHTLTCAEENITSLSLVPVSFPCPSLRPRTSAASAHG